MTRADELRALLARVEATSGPDRVIDTAIYQALRPADIEALRAMHAAGDVSSYWFWMSDSPYTASIDAAVALVKKSLPGWDEGYQSCREDGFFGEVWRHGYHDDTVVRGQGSSPALAIVAALLRALLQADQTDAGGRDG